MIERIIFNDIELGLIVRRSFSKKGIEFLTPDTYSLQIGYMNRVNGYVIAPHLHNPVERTIRYTNEVLVIKTGKIRVDFYNDCQDYLQSAILEEGDIVLLNSGGHGFEMLEDSEIIEIKQGPYVGEHDKTRFSPIEKTKLKFGGKI